ncbi:hypothetical protein CR513_48839, partial [Mucuna pruriens]
MGSQVCETLAFINGDDGMQINGALLMSLMEEPSPSDHHESDDDDRLDSLIRSFEAEISGSKMGDHDSTSSMGSELIMSNNMEECATQSWNMGEVDHGMECWASSSEFGVEWVGMDLVPPSPFEDRSWCFDPCGDEYYAMANNFKVYDGFALGEHGYNISLWQDMACN